MNEPFPVADVDATASILQTGPHNPATLLRNTLADLGMKQLDLAKRCGLSAKHINRIAQGEARISTVTAMAFSRATGVPALAWLHAQGLADIDALRQRPRVWWSGSQGVIEQLVYLRGPVRYLVVTTNCLLDDLPDDVVELVPAQPHKDTRRSRPPQAPSRLVDEVANRLRDYRLHFGPSTLSLLREGATTTCMNGGEREHVARVALEVVDKVLGGKVF